MEPEITLVRDFAIIMAVAGAAIVVFRALKQPTALGYLLAGVLVGPFTLPLLGISAPFANTDSIRLLADLGLVLLLFALGMEFGWQRIRQLGLQVVLIGAIEITFMVALGYEIGTLLGWSSANSIFLGAALSISSSAIIVKVLRDTGTLMEEHGRLIVGVLVVEDFAAVLLLSILSGVASAGTFSFGDAWLLLGKLAIFLVSALVLGGLFAPRLMNFVARYKSRESLLIVALALCFGLALVAVELGISAAAGAFIIGTVLGDTDHAEELAHIVSPIRDVFAALFFVSIGMLIDLSLFKSFLIPALIVSVAFMTGKVFIVTFASMLSGRAGRPALHVGMGMPQMGEFSLAMIKVGADKGAVSSFLYPVIVASTAITTLLYPFGYRAAGSLASLIQRCSPKLLQQYAGVMPSWTNSLRMALALKGEMGGQMRRQSKVIIINVGIMVILIALGTAVLEQTPELAEQLRDRKVPLNPGFLGLIVSVAVISFCTPSAVFIWRALQRLTDSLADAIIWKGSQSPIIWGRAPLKAVIRDSFLIIVAVLLIFWSLPFFSKLVLIDSFLAPVPVLLFVGFVAVLWRAALKIHHALVNAFSHTFLGERYPDQNREFGD